MQRPNAAPVIDDGDVDAPGDGWDRTERRTGERRGSRRPWAQSTIRVGNHMASVADVAESLDRFGDRFVRHVFTAAEAATCSGPAGPSAERLAARLAAKEAVAKALRLDGPATYLDIEVRTDPDGGPEIALTGDVERHAEAMGVVDTSLSLTHDDDRASAVFVAVLDTPLPSIPLPAPTLDPLAKLSDLFPAGIPVDGSLCRPHGTDHSPIHHDDTQDDDR